MGAVDELGSRGLIDWSRAVVDGLARHICHGHLRYQLWWLPRMTWRDAGGVLVVLLGGAVWMGTATAPAVQATKGTGLGVLFTLQLLSTIMIIVCAGA